MDCECVGCLHACSVRSKVKARAGTGAPTRGRRDGLGRLGGAVGETLRHLCGARIAARHPIDVASGVRPVPSAAFEGFGLVVLEAAASGTPTIATRVGGLPEALAGLDSSLVVPPNDPNALARRLADAARGEIPARGDTRAWAGRHGWDLVAQRHRALYVGVLSKASPVGRNGRVTRDDR